MLRHREVVGREAQAAAVTQAATVTQAAVVTQAEMKVGRALARAVEAARHQAPGHPEEAHRVGLGHLRLA